MSIHAAIRRSTYLVTSLGLALAVAAFVVVFVSQATGRYRFVPVLSGSMSPFVEAGDIAILQPRPAQNLVEGDVIAFEAPIDGSPLTLHRIIEIVSPAPDLVVRTKGDANTAADPWEARLVDNLLWRATSHVDDLGTPVLFLNRAKTRFLWISIASLLLGWWGMSAIWRDPPGSDSETDSSSDAERSVRPRVSHFSSFVVVVALALTFAGVPADRSAGVAASFNSMASGSQLVSSAPARDSLILAADLLCSSAGVPTSIELTWTPAANPTSQYEVYRGTLAGGPYDALVGRTRGTVRNFSDPLTGTNGIPLYYVVRTDSAEVPVEESNEVFAVSICEPALPSVTTTLPALTTTTAPIVEPTAPLEVLPVFVFGAAETTGRG